jgi:hypothetical protein
VQYLLGGPPANLSKAKNCVTPGAIIATSIQDRLKSGYCLLTDIGSGNECRMMIKGKWSAVMEIKVCNEKIQSFDCFQVAQ